MKDDDPFQLMDDGVAFAAFIMLLIFAFLALSLEKVMA